MSYAEWNANAFYLTNDIVYEGNEDYVALSDNFNQQPSLSPLVWNPIGPPGPPVGVSSVNAGTDIVITGPPSNPVVNVDSFLTGVLTINGQPFPNESGVEDIFNPNVSVSVATLQNLTPSAIISLSYFNDGSPNYVAPTNQILSYQIDNPNQFTIFVSAPSGVPGGKLVIAWSILRV